jgi:osmotically-inducible protein OsmY
MGVEEQPQDYVIAHLREAFARDGRVNELNVDVTVAGQRVFLTGEVPTEERRRAVGDVAAEVVPGYEIRNQTTVSDVAGPGEAEELS